MITFLCSPNNPTGLVEPEAVVRAVLDMAPAIVLVDEAYGQFADWSASTLVDEERPLVVTRTYSKTWSMAGTRLGYLVGPSWLVAELDKVVLPYHLDTAKQIAGRLALRFADDMEARVKQIVSERERLSDALAALGGGRVAQRRQLRPVPPDGRRASERPRGVAGPARAQRADPRLLGLAAARRVPAGHGRHPDENDAFLDALAEVLR